MSGTGSRRSGRSGSGGVHRSHRCFGDRVRRAVCRVEKLSAHLPGLKPGIGPQGGTFRQYASLRAVKADYATLIRPAFCLKNAKRSVPFPRTRRPYRRRTPKEARLINLRRRFRRVSERAGLAALSPGYKWAFRLLLFVLALEAGLLTIMMLSPWPLGVTLRHLGAMRNCDAARAMGLAPARRGEPGYWPKHDADNDGIACEPWPHRWSDR